MQGETVTLITRQLAGEDRFGKPVFTDVAADVEDVMVAPVVPVMDANTGQIVDTDGFDLHLPPDVHVPADARFIVRGTEYPVVGPSRDWGYFSSGEPAGNVVAVRRSAFVDE
jgi:hypothetical protein